MGLKKGILLSTAGLLVVVLLFVVFYLYLGGPQKVDVVQRGRGEWRNVPHSVLDETRYYCIPGGQFIGNIYFKESNGDFEVETEIRYDDLDGESNIQRAFATKEQGQRAIEALVAKTKACR